MKKRNLTTFKNEQRGESGKLNWIPNNTMQLLNDSNIIANQILTAC